MKNRMERYFIRFTSYLILFSFLLNNIVVFAAIETMPSHPVLNISSPMSNDKIQNLFIPENYGSISKRWHTGGNDKFIICIKDAHCNYEAQQNIAKILETLVRDYNISLVGVEGAAGNVDLGRFGKLEDNKVKEKVADTFVKKGIVTGPEYLKITKYNEMPFGIYGVENGELYVKNFISFRNTISNRQETQSFIDELSKVICRLKEKLFSKELFEFDDKAGLYNDNKTSLSDYIKDLYNYGNIDRRRCSNLNKVFRSVKLEGEVDFKKVEREREQLIRYVEKNLPKEELEDLVKKSLQYKLGKISSVNYYTFLGKFVVSCKLSTVNLRRYISLVRLQSKIDSDKLFSEIRDLEKNIKDGFFRNNIERSLDALSERTNILNKLFSLQLTRENLQYFKDHKGEFRTSSLLSLIKVQAPINNIQLNPIFNDDAFLKRIDDCIVPGGRFYEEAVLRDEALVKNTLKEMGDENKDIAVMIAGGFHAEGITRILQEKDVSYMVITPKITKTQDDCPYLSLMMDERIKIPAAVSNGQNLAPPEKVGQGSNPIASGLGIDGLRADQQAKILELIERGAEKIQQSKIADLELTEEDKRKIRLAITEGITEGRITDNALRVLNLIIGEESPDIYERQKGDQTISSSGELGTTRKEHEEYHARVYIPQGIEELVKKLKEKGFDVETREDGYYDFRKLISERGAENKKLIVMPNKEENVYIELRIETDGALVIIYNGFKGDHAGRGEYAVYARNEAKAQHELTELRLWAGFAIEKSIVTQQDIAEGKLGQKIRDWMNDADISDDITAGRQQLIYSKSDEFHKKGLEAEFQDVIGDDIDDGLERAKKGEKDRGWIKEKLEDFMYELKDADVEVIGASPGAPGTLMYRVVTTTGYKALIGVNLYNSKRSMLAIETDHNRYMIISDLLVQQYKPKIIEFLKAKEKEGKIRTNSEEYTSRIFFSLINPFIVEEIFYRWYLNSPILRLLMSRIGRNGLREDLVNHISIISKELWEARKRAQVGGHAFERNVGVELGTIHGLYDLIRTNRLPDIPDSTIVHEIAHLALYKLTDEEIETIRPHIKDVLRIIITLPAYEDLNPRELAEEGIIRIVTSLSSGDTRFTELDRDNQAHTIEITDETIDALRKAGLLESAQTTQEAISEISGQAERQSELDFIVSSGDGTGHELKDTKDKLKAGALGILEKYKGYFLKGSGIKYGGTEYDKDIVSYEEAKRGIEEGIIVINDEGDDLIFAPGKRKADIPWRTYREATGEFVVITIKQMELFEEYCSLYKTGKRGQAGVKLAELTASAPYKIGDLFVDNYGNCYKLESVYVDVLHTAEDFRFQYSLYPVPRKESDLPKFGLEGLTATTGKQERIKEIEKALAGIEGKLGTLFLRKEITEGKGDDYFWGKWRGIKDIIIQEGLGDDLNRRIEELESRFERLRGIVNRFDKRLFGLGSELNKINPFLPDAEKICLDIQEKLKGIESECEGYAGAEFINCVKEIIINLKKNIKRVFTPIKTRNDAIRGRIRFLEDVKQKMQKDQLTDILMFGDKHGKADDLEKILKAARESAKTGRKLNIIGHGDTFDRGNKNLRNWQILQELKQIAAQNHNISVDLLFGNHDVHLIQAMLLGGVPHADIPGGQALINEIGELQARELALWMLKNLKLFCIDERGFLHVHAGIPIDQNGNPLISRGQLESWQRDLEEIQEELSRIAPIYKERAERLFNDTHNIFWIKRNEWLAHLVKGGMEEQVRIDEMNKDRLFEMLMKIKEKQLADAGTRFDYSQLREQIEQTWPQILIQNQDLFKKMGVQFEVLSTEPEVDKDKLDNFLFQMGINGVVFGHIHLKKLLNLDNKIFCVDVDEEDPGHLIFNGEGIRFSALARSTDDLIAVKGDILANIQEEIIRLKQRLGETAEREQSELGSLRSEKDKGRAIAEKRISQKHKNIKYSKDLMRYFKLALRIIWADGTYGLTVNYRRDGGLEIKNIKIRGQEIIGIVTKNGLLKDSLLIKQGSTLGIGMYGRSKRYSFVIDGETFDVGKYNDEFVLIQRKSAIREEGFILSRTIVNTETEVQVTLEPGAESKTVIKPFLLVETDEDMRDVVAEIMRGVEYDPVRLILSPAKEEGLQKVVPRQAGKIDTDNLRRYLEKLCNEAIQTNDRAKYHRTLKLIRASIYNDHNVLIMRGRMLDDEIEDTLNNIGHFNINNCRSLINTARRVDDYGEVIRELEKVVGSGGRALRHDLSNQKADKIIESAKGEEAISIEKEILLDIDAYRQSDSSRREEIIADISSLLCCKLYDPEEQDIEDYEKIQIRDRIKEILENIIKLQDMVPGIQGLPAKLLRSAGLKREQFIDLGKAGCIGSFLHDDYLWRINFTLRQAQAMIKAILARKMPDGTRDDFDGSYAKCRNFHEAIRGNPLVRDNIYRIIKEVEVHPAKTVKMKVRHSLNFGNGNWEKSLQFLADFPAKREESVYTQGGAAGSVIIEINADVRLAFGADVVSAVNPYTGEKVVSEDTMKTAIDPEQYRDHPPKLKVFPPFFQSDELFARFNLREDLQRVLVVKPNMIEPVKEKLSKLGLGNITVVLESDAEAHNIAEGNENKAEVEIRTIDSKIESEEIINAEREELQELMDTSLIEVGVADITDREGISIKPELIEKLITHIDTPVILITKGGRRIEICAGNKDILLPIRRGEIKAVGYKGRRINFEMQIFETDKPGDIEVVFATSSNITPEIHRIMISADKARTRRSEPTDGGTSFAKEISKTIEGEGILSPADIEKIKKNSHEVTDINISSLNAELQRQVRLHLLDANTWGDNVYFSVNGQRKYAVGLVDEKIVDVYVTNAMLDLFKQNAEIMNALLMHESFDDGKEVGAHAGAWREVKKLNSEGMMDLIKIMIDNLELDKIEALIKEYEDLGDAGRAAKGWDKFEEQINDYLIKELANRLAGLLKIEPAEVNKILKTDSKILIQSLIKILKEDGVVTPEEIQVIVQQANLVEDVFAKVNTGKGSKVTKGIKDKVVFFLAIRALEKAHAVSEYPQFIITLQGKLKKMAGTKGIDGVFIENIIMHLFKEKDAFVEYENKFYSSKYFSSFVKKMKEMLGVTEADAEINNLFEKLFEYKYTQVSVRKAFAVKKDDTPVPAGDVNEIINRYVHYREKDGGYKSSVANVLALHIIGEIGLNEEARQNVNKLMSRKGLEAGKLGEEMRAIRSSTYAEDKAIDSYGKISAIIREKTGIALNDIDLIAPTTFAYDVEEIFGSLEAEPAGKFNLYEIYSLSLTMKDLIGKVQVQETKRQGNRNLFVTEKPLLNEKKDALIEYFKNNGIENISRNQFVTVSEYTIKAHENGNRVVAMVGDGLGRVLKDNDAHNEGDRVLLANQAENDFMLLANIAVIAAIAEDVGEMKEKCRKLFKVYYKGTLGEKDIDVWVNKIEDINGIINIILPPISRFVKAHYDALRGARELICQAA